MNPGFESKNEEAELFVLLDAFELTNEPILIPLIIIYINIADIIGNYLKVNADPLFDKIVGMIYGRAIGDTLGAQVESWSNTWSTAWIQ
jgi:hypothetical protein